MLRFVEKYERNPETDYEVAIAEAMSHGASGMDKTWHDLITIDDIKNILKEIGVVDGINEIKDGV